MASAAVKGASRRTIRDRIKEKICCTHGRPLHAYDPRNVDEHIETLIRVYREKTKVGSPEDIDLPYLYSKHAAAVKRERNRSPLVTHTTTKVDEPSPISVAIAHQENEIVKGVVELAARLSPLFRHACESAIDHNENGKLTDANPEEVNISVQKREVTGECTHGSDHGLSEQHSESARTKKAVRFSNVVSELNAESEDPLLRDGSMDASEEISSNTQSPRAQSLGSVRYGSAQNQEPLLNSSDDERPFDCIVTSNSRYPCVVKTKFCCKIM